MIRISDVLQFAATESRLADHLISELAFPANNKASTLASEGLPSSIIDCGASPLFYTESIDRYIVECFVNEFLTFKLCFIRKKWPRNLSLPVRKKILAVASAAQYFMLQSSSQCDKEV